ncbi:MAG: methionine--tRNA ligase [Chloroflexi bacterium HGW-Chloroflexi-1]|nr:MAG: methionine--tRNA ligase [Chloroflexi bacterium HGW-Chloroflexi-1]
MPEKILVSVAWPYCNGDMHIGHIAGAYLPADIFARYHRLRGNDVLMVSGSDTHGTPITVRAEEEGITPRAVVDRYHPRNTETLRRLGISFDLFTETDTENHWAITQELFKTHLKHGYVYRDSMKQLYCLDCARWLADRYVEGVCSFCGHEAARGDQCDNCGRTYDAIELGFPRCGYCGGTHIEIRVTEHFFLDLARLNDPLLAWLNDGRKGHWRSNVINATRARLESRELHGRPITRDIQWGVPIPLPGYQDKRIYVWYDAVIGYLAASKEWAGLTGDPEAWRAWWQDPDARAYYFIGKDNIEFHTIIWPGMLIGYDESLNLPYDVPANEYLNVEGRKLSKSRRWMIGMSDALDRYDPDPWRYALAASQPESQDVNFTWDEFVRRNNEELVSTWGNLANRVLGFAYKRFDGVVPEPGELDDDDRALLDQVAPTFERATACLDAVKLKAALGEAMALAREANRYLNLKEPWQQIKVDQAAAATSIYVALRVIDSLKTLFAPFLPFTSQQLHEYLGYDGQLFGRLYTEEVTETERRHLVLRYDGSGAYPGWAPSELAPGQALRQPGPLYLKLEPNVVDEEIERMAAGA